ncbi:MULTISPECIES: hypothetical protein [Bacteria]|uniref:hypothetical protein n=1 Tax=Bacteria TaxID=2 RepID=UPI003C7B3532
MALHPVECQFYRSPTGTRPPFSRFIRSGELGWPCFDDALSIRLFGNETATVPRRRTTSLELLP